VPARGDRDPGAAQRRDRLLAMIGVVDAEAPMG
jgi:hypothetical protein